MSLTPREVKKRVLFLEEQVKRLQAQIDKLAELSGERFCGLETRIRELEKLVTNAT